MHKQWVNHFDSRSRSDLNVKCCSLCVVSYPYLPHYLKDVHATFLKCAALWVNVQQTCVSHFGFRSRSHMTVMRLSLCFVSEGISWNWAHMFSSLNDGHKAYVSHFGFRLRSCFKVIMLRLCFLFAPYFAHSLKDVHDSKPKRAIYWDNVQKKCVSHLSSRSRSHIS